MDGSKVKFERFEGKGFEMFEGIVEDGEIRLLDLLKRRGRRR